MESIHINEPRWRHFIITLPLFIIVRAWQASIKLKTDDVCLPPLTNPSRLVGVAWHRNIFFLPICKYIFRPEFPMAGLVSASRDGCYLCAFFKLMRIGAVRGSTNRRGVGAIFDLVERLHSSDVFITPDGPRGPRNRAKSGFVKVAQQSGARILALRFTPSRFITVKSWDAFVLPLPFSSVKLEVLEFENYEALEKSASAQNIEPQVLIQNFLNEVER